MTADDLVRALADLVAAELARRAAPAPGGTYDGFRLPPDVKSREWFNRLVKGMPGAVRRGRLWTVPVESWDAARAKKKAPPSAQDLARAALAKAGYRRTG